MFYCRATQDKQNVNLNSFFVKTNLSIANFHRRGGIWEKNPKSKIYEMHECLQCRFHASCAHKSTFLSSKMQRAGYKVHVAPTLKKSKRQFKLTALLAKSWICLTTVFLQLYSNRGTFLSVLLAEPKRVSVVTYEMSLPKNARLCCSAPAPTGSLHLKFSIQLP